MINETKKHVNMSNEAENEGISRFLSRDECEALAKKVANMAVGGGESALLLNSGWNGNIRYARNEISSGGEIRANGVVVLRDIEGAIGAVSCSHVDDIGLEAAVRRAERISRTREKTGDRRFREHFVRIDKGESEHTIVHNHSSASHLLIQTIEEHSNPKIFFDSTYSLRAEERVNVIGPLITTARKEKVVAAGYIEVSARGRAVMQTWGRSLYYPYTEAQFSVTVRNTTGTGSGWAGVDFADWNRIDPILLSEIATDKCLRSQNPVAVEPGRYTAILEAQAVSDIFNPVINHLSRKDAEDGNGPFALGGGMTKIGLPVLDMRVTVSTDPMDPDLGYPPFDAEGNVFHAVNWIEGGVLKELSYLRSYAIRALGRNSGLPNSGSYRLHGGETSIDDMISTTKRGLLVTRFHGINVIDKSSLLSSGYTRDGLWLVEDGKITKAVKNFRITESPLFIFNNLETLGKSVRVFRPGSPTVVPPAKVRDFSFTSLSEAI